MSEIDARRARPLERPARLVVLSGCSGGGKSTLLEALDARGFATCSEPGRQIVREQMRIDGPALPWVDMRQFIEHVVTLALHQADVASSRGGLTIFDRGLVDAYAYFRREGLVVPAQVESAMGRVRYADTVFMTPPWPEIFASDAERRHGLEAAVAEYRSLLCAYADLGYTVVEIPKAPVATRADFLVERLAVEGQ
jgi:predicted ATPase